MFLPHHSNNDYKIRIHMSKRLFSYSNSKAFQRRPSLNKEEQEGI